MTALFHLRLWLRETGVPFEEEPGDGLYESHLRDAEIFGDLGTVITVSAGPRDKPTPKTAGYEGSHTIFYFDKDGSLLAMGAWG